MRLRLPQLALFAAALVFGLALFWRAQEPAGLSFQVDGRTAYVNGTTSGRDQSAIRTLLRDNPQVEHLVFGIMPGTQDMTSNYRLARSIRRAGLSTELKPTSHIASGAVDLFLAGKTRRVACGARIGVHSWGAQGFDAQDVRWDTHRSMSRDFLSDMGIDPDFYDFRNRMAGADELHILTDSDIAQWGVATEPRYCD